MREGSVVDFAARSLPSLDRSPSTATAGPDPVAFQLDAMSSAHRDAVRHLDAAIESFSACQRVLERNGDEEPTLELPTATYEPLPVATLFEALQDAIGTCRDGRAGRHYDEALDSFERYVLLTEEREPIVELDVSDEGAPPSLAVVLLGLGRLLGSDRAALDASGEGA